MYPNVYIFDKDPEYSALLKGICGTTDLASTVFNSAQEFLQQMPLQGILVLDIKMSFCEGMEIINALARVDNDLKLILMSSYDDSVLRAAKYHAQSRSLVVTACLRKPILVSGLRQALEQAEQGIAYASINDEVDSQVFQGMAI